MHGLYSRLIKPIHFVGDILLVNLSFLFSYYIIFKDFTDFENKFYLGLLLFFNLAWSISVYAVKGYKLYRVTSVISISLILFRLFFLFFLLIETFNGFTKELGYSREHLFLSYVFISLSIYTWRMSLLYMLRIYRKSGYNYRRVIIAGIGETSNDLYDFFIKHPEHGYKFMGFFDNNITNNSLYKGPISDIEKFVLENKIDEIYCSISKLSSEQLSAIVTFSDNNFIRIKLLPDLNGLSYKKFKLDLYDFLPVIALRSMPLDDNINKLIKRFFDLFFSVFVCLLILWWLLPILAIIVKIDSKGPAFFSQERSGLNNRTFGCIKLRTMKVNPDANLKQATRDDPRITRAGKFLRKYNLDELPQFINVLLGNMSVVGPRPHMLKHTEEYSQIIDKYMIRHFIKPGITGLSQISGFRGETTSPLMMKRRIKVDIFYIENWSFLLDIKIIIKTLYTSIVGDKNAF